MALTAHRQLMRGIRALGAGFLLLGLSAAPAAADSSPSPSASDSGDGPTQAGTSFRTATEIDQEQQATASGSTGDYMYWSFKADSGRRPTVHATVKLPERHASETWQIDVYDGLRRRQACQYGAQTRTVTTDTSSAELSCTLRTVRAWSEPWANDPLPGTYYLRLTLTGVGAGDLGLPVSAEVRVDSKDTGGSAAVDGSLAKPLVPGVATRPEDTEDSSDSGDGATEDNSPSGLLSSFDPDDGWSSGWWTDRWIWTAAGGVLAAVAGVGGYALTRGSGRPSRVPPPPRY